MKPELAEQDRSPCYSLSIDTGGTFTDGFASGPDGQVQVKVDTTPHDLTQGFMACVEAAAEAMNEPLEDFLALLRDVRFSSTIATNAVVQRLGHRVGLIVSDGGLAAYGSDGEFASLSDFIDPDFVVAVPEAVSDEGVVELAPNPADVEAAVRRLLERGVGMIVISFRNADKNPANEAAARELITASYPRHYLGAIPVLQAARLSLSPSDFGRTALAILNAYLHPSLVRSLYKAEDGLRTSGHQRPLLIVNTDGSTTRVAKTRALDTFNSGPSAGVIGAANVAAAIKAEHVCTFDVGGTTTDVAYIHDGTALRTPHTVAASLSVPHPAIDLWSFGLGGGSIIARKDGALTVGPNSAGSSPGPACFGLGGTHLTPTDVWLILGYIDPEGYLGGRRTLRKDASIAALDAVFPGDDRSAEDKALDALDAVHRALADGMRAWAANHPELLSGPGRWLFSYGGGGGLLCVEAAQSLGIDQVVVFPQSSVFSAFGGGLMPIAHAYRASASRLAGPFKLAALVGAAERDLRAEGITDLAAVKASVSVSSTDGVETEIQSDLASLKADDASVDLTPRSHRVDLRVEVERPLDVTVRMGVPELGKADRTVHTREGARAYPIVRGLGEPNAAPVDGPAFLAAQDTTIVIPEGWHCTFDALGFGTLRKGASQ
ncbi:hydantoinase/oxoprolinase family protein [Acuticoccus mangrovi]|uniref:Hydantoinase/oxoprolinase family protein n=1 Tax=Acuticoccus mangrovi TaxID=2796142 RepID=A0A934IVI3_9HYPH|nr:hydantoinase/oxoprolinase family protein [Acuticoccus mangrovi]MBJ3778509.1 hydantoinase/oxoprolinase family protein [Acuticoccus mangrovi]